MVYLRLFTFASLLAFSASGLAAQDRARPSAAFLAHYDAPFQRAYDVDGTRRTAAVFAPKAARETPAPLILAFHGNGGDMKTAAESMLYQKRWKEVIVVYPQGLNTPGGPDPEGRLSGRDRRPDTSNRDIKFVDALVRSIAKDYKLDNRRVYVTGQSNGGFFAYKLCAARGDKIAAVTPCAALAEFDVAALKPKPVLHVAGETDPYMAFAEQERLTERLREINGCGPGLPWLSGGRETLRRPGRRA